MRWFFYFLVGLICLMVQTAIFPRFFPVHLKPDLLLILVVYLGVNEQYGRGGIAAYFLGILLDVYAGTFMGMYGMAFLVILFVVRGTVSFFNSENPFLLLFMVFCGTLLETAMLILLGGLAKAGDVWLVIARWILPQVLLNVLVAYIIMFMLTRLQRRLPRLVIPGLSRLNENYES